MKRALSVAALFALLSGGYLGIAHVSGGAFYDFGLGLGGDTGWLRRTALSFWEDIQFKDFDSAALYHAPDRQSGVDIPYLLERLFALKPELLDIMSYEVVMAEVDSTGLRSRVKTRIKVKNLTTGDIEEKELMLFFHRDDPDAPWYMELDSSLRSLEADKDKKH